MMQEENLAYHVCVDLCMGRGTKDLGGEVNPHLLAHPYHHNEAILWISEGGMGGGREGMKKEREEGKGGREGGRWREEERRGWRGRREQERGEGKERNERRANQSLTPASVL